MEALCVGIACLVVGYFAGRSRARAQVFQHVAGLGWMTMEERGRLRDELIQGTHGQPG